MTINDQIRDEKIQYRPYHQVKFVNMNILLVKINQQQIIEQAKLTYSPLGKAFEKQIKTIEDQGEKQIDALKDLKPKEQTKRLRINLVINQKLQLYLMSLLMKEKNNERVI